jgi:hypothetical protein
VIRSLVHTKNEMIEREKGGGWSDENLSHGHFGALLPSSTSWVKIRASALFIITMEREGRRKRDIERRRTQMERIRPSLQMGTNASEANVRSRKVESKQRGWVSPPVCSSNVLLVRKFSENWLVVGREQQAVDHVIKLQNT